MSLLSSSSVPTISQRMLVFFMRLFSSKRLVEPYRSFGRRNGFVWKSENGAKLKNTRMPKKLCTNAQFFGHFLWF